MTTPMQVSLAVMMAASSHKGQLDKAGKPYIEHPLRVMESMPDNDHKAVAVLHDTIEDTVITPFDLREAGFSDTVINAVCALTHADNEPYDEYIERVSMDPIARVVKLADLRDNMDVTRIETLSSSDMARIRKYHKAYRLLDG